VKVLIACEYSGRVRNAFRALGHDAWSCDLLESEDNSSFHIKGDVLPVLKESWDLMIAHPPCTYLCNSGERWMIDNPKRQAQRLKAVAFVKELWNSGIEKIAVENPIGHLSSAMNKPSQIIQLWQFGHPETKATCLWLKNLPRLQPTNDVKVEMSKLSLAERSKVHYMSPGPNR
jgi:hypothetical protein